MQQLLFDIVEKRLTELIGDYLDSEDHIIDQLCAEVKDPIQRDITELHIRMAKVALSEYKKTMVNLKS